VSDVHDGRVTDLIPCKQVSPPEAAEGDGQVRPSRSVHDAGEQIDTGWPIDSDHWNGEIIDPGEEPCYRRPWNACGSSSE
jgi:hypothetical protein